MPDDKPDKPDKPERTQYVEADRVMTERTIKEVERTSLPDLEKARMVDVLRQHHENCAGGREKCVGEP